jgi:di/tripeptidase
LTDKKKKKINFSYKLISILLKFDINIEEFIDCKDIYRFLQSPKEIKIQNQGEKYMKTLFCVKVLEMIYFKLMEKREEYLSNIKTKDKYLEYEEEVDRNNYLKKSREKRQREINQRLKRDKEILIKTNKEKFHSESTKVVINDQYKKSDLANLTSFLFYVKDKSSNLLHFSEEAKEIFNNIKDQSKNNIKDKDINRIKSFSEFFNANKCTYDNLINTLKYETPLLFFFKNTKFGIIEETVKEINKELKKLKSIKTFDYEKELESQLNNPNEK